MAVVSFGLAVGTNSATNFASCVEHNNSEASSENAIEHCDADSASHSNSASDACGAANTVPGTEPAWSIAGDRCHSVSGRITFSGGNGHTDYSEFESADA